jgi:hypothetical protein
LLAVIPSSVVRTFSGALVPPTVQGTMTARFGWALKFVMFAPVMAELGTTIFLLSSDASVEVKMPISWSVP